MGTEATGELREDIRDLSAAIIGMREAISANAETLKGVTSQVTDHEKRIRLIERTISYALGMAGFATLLLKALGKL